MKTFKILDNKQEIKQFIIELYKINRDTDYKIRFVINSSLLELCDKHFINERLLRDRLDKLEVDGLDIKSGNVKYKLEPHNIDTIIIEDSEIKVKLVGDRSFIIKLNKNKQG